MDERRKISEALKRTEEILSSRPGGPVPELTSPQFLEKFGAYWELLTRWNRKIRLVGRAEEFPFRHLADSLMALPLLGEEPRTVLDFGSGGGFPGLPLAIARPEFQFFLSEPNHKKAAFLKQVVRVLSLNNVQIYTSFLRGEPEREGISEKFDILVFRAVDPGTVFPIARRYLRTEGEILYWGKEEPKNFKDDITLIEKFEYNLYSSQTFSIFRYQIRR